MTVLSRGLIFQPVLLACTYNIDTIITLQKEEEEEEKEEGEEEGEEEEKKEDSRLKHLVIVTKRSAWML